MTKSPSVKKIQIVSFHFDNDRVVGSARPRALVEVLTEEFEGSIEIFRPKTRHPILWGLVFCLTAFNWRKQKVVVSLGPFWLIPWILISRILVPYSLIVDLRDVWSGHLESLNSDGSFSGRLRVSLSRFLEKNLYRLSCEFWVCTPGMMKFYSDLFGQNEKIKLALNGHSVDPLFADSLRKEKKRSGPLEINLCCIGKFAEYDVSKAERLIRLLQSFKQNHSHISVELHLIGSSTPENSLFIQQRGLQDWVKLLPRMDYGSALRFAASCDYGVCIIRNEAYDFGTKVFDYIGIGLPVVDCFDKDSSFREFFEHYIFPIEHPISISRTIRGDEGFSRKQQFSEIISGWKA
jgi:hypothetical protein